MPRPRNQTDEEDDSISISKEVLPSLEGFGFSETMLGETRGSLKQYRNASGLHVREYRDRFEVHRDKVDPRVDPLGHLLKDSPETLLALGATLLASNRSNNNDKRKAAAGGEENTRYTRSQSPLLHGFGILLLFLSLNGFLGWLKRRLFS